MKPEYQPVLADLKAREAELEQALRDVRHLIQFVVGEPSAPPNGIAPHDGIYADCRNLADLAKACLKSVNGAWLSSKEIADRLLEAGVAKRAEGLTGHINTALVRRKNAALSPDREIQYENGQFRYQAA